ncbi:MAG: prenyltransferase [Candidatus Cryptobacteroides sp.]
MGKHTFKEWLIAVRPWSFPASAMPVVATVAFLFWKEHPINLLTAVWALVNIIIFHAAGNTWSDWFDYKRGVDRKDTYGSKILTSGTFTPKEIFILSICLLAIAIAGGIGLMLLCGLPLLWIGLAGAFLTVFYPFLKYNALGDLDIIIAYAVLPTIGTSFAVSGFVDWNVMLIALPVGLITDGILHANNTRDISSDKRSGIRTFAMMLGKKSSAILYNAEMYIPYIWLLAFVIAGMLPWTVLLTIVSFPIALGCAKAMTASLKEDAALISDLDEKTAKLQMIFSLLLSLGFVAGRFIA